MERVRRRAFLASLGTTAALAGCLAPAGAGADVATDRESTPTTGSDGERTTSPPSTSSTPTTARLRLRALTDVPRGAPLTVYPPALREWLRRAATRDEPVRGHDETFVYMPKPVLSRVELVELVGSTDVDGVYDFTVDGGTRYDLLVGAEPVDDPPANATGTPVEALSTERRDFVERAVDESRRATVVPESRLGEWVRTEFFGGYVSHEGTVYRGHEIQQTDAAFFSTEIWYVLSLSATSDEASEPVRLRFTAVPDAFAGIVEPLLEERSPDQREVRSDPQQLPDDVVQFVDETAYLLTHTAVFAVEIEQ